MNNSEPERVGRILPRVLAEIEPRVVKDERPKPAPVGGSLRAALADWFANKPVKHQGPPPAYLQREQEPPPPNDHEGAPPSDADVPATDPRDTPFD